MRNALGSNQYCNKHKAHYWGSIALLAIGYLVIQIVIYGIQEEHSRLTVAFASESLVASQNIQTKKLEDQNQALKDTLNREFTNTTDQTTKDIVKYYLKEYFGPQAANAEKIFTCESGLRPQALNSKNTNGTQDHGIPQINSVHDKQFQAMFGIPLALGAHDIALSLSYAKSLYDKQGWIPWTCSKITGVIK